MNLKKLGGRKPKPPEIRFHESYVPEPNTGCWLWLGTNRGSNNYGCIKINGKPLVAHRYSWMLKYGEIPNGKCVCHRCDNPSCVNPTHLFLATNAENTQDKVKKNRQVKGEKHHLAKLTEDLVRRIKADSRNANQICKELGLSHLTVQRIKQNKGWKHVL